MRLSRDEAYESDFWKLFIEFCNVTARQDSSAALDSCQRPRAENAASFSFYTLDDPDREIRKTSKDFGVNYRIESLLSG